MRDRVITPFRLLSAAQRWPAATRGAFVRKFAAGRDGLEAEVLALLGADAPETGFLRPPLPRLGGAGAALSGTTTLAGADLTGPGDATSSWVGRRLLSRYLLRRVLARGGAGTVYEADDEVARCAAAVKVLHRPIRGQANFLAHVRREVACLRLLRLPGVVQLHDDGIEDDRYVLAMELVRGEPFPGVPGVVPWKQIALPTLALVETMARVHAVGVVHGDLKPINVPVQAYGRPVVLDLGVSGGPAIDVARARTGPVGATARYMSPEHARGDPVGPAADLYAIGLMVYEALSGRRPHDAREVADLYAQRRSLRPPPLRTVAPTVEPEVAAWVDALLEGDPEVRLRRAEAALALVPGYLELPARVAALRDRAPRAPVPREELEALFTGPRPFHHLPEDGAQALLDRTDGTPDAVIAELVSWVRAGLARWDRDGVATDRPALERLRLGQRASRPSPGPSVSTSDPPSQGSAARLYELVACGKLDQVPAEAERLGDAEAELGRSDAAQQIFDEGIRAAEQLGQRRAAERLVIRAVDAALDQGTVSACDRLLYRLALLGDLGPRLRRVEGIVRAALALGRGEHARAEESLAAFGVDDDEDPGVMRCLLRVRARFGEGHTPEEHEAILAEVAAAVGRFPGDRSGFELDAWLGWLRFRQGRYEEAARLYRAGAASAARRIRRLSHLSMAASAWMEHFELDAAEADAGEALSLLSGARHPLFEAHNTRILRGCAYRRERALAPDLAMIGGFAGLPAVLGAGIACTEAAFAWRAGDPALAAAILEPLFTQELGRANPQAHALIGCFLIGMGAQPVGASAAELVRAALGGAFPGLTVQSLGLLALHAPERPNPYAEPLLAHARRIPGTQWHRRREVLSVAEALAYAGLPSRE